MSGRGIQTDVTFIQKPQVAVSKTKSLDDNNLVMKPIPLILSSKSQSSYPYVTEVSFWWNQKRQSKDLL